MRRRHLLLLSLVLFVIGCMLNLFLCSALVDLFGASFEVPGSTLGGGAPIKLEKMDCPLFLGKQEPGNFSAIISNSTNSEHRASVRFFTRDAVQSLSASHQVLVIPPDSTTRVTWLMSFDKSGSRFVHVELINDDLTSYSYEQKAYHYCDIAVIDVLGLPASIVIVLGGGSLVLATVILIYARRRL
jgi:hypothetical protein